MTKKNEASNDDPRVFQQGVTARLGSISKDEAPYDESDHNYKVWFKGWESADSAA